MLHSKTRKKPKLARSKSGAKKPVRKESTRPRAARGRTKQEALLALLSQPAGTTINAMMRATGWQPHSIRGFLAGVVNRRLKLKLSSAKVDGVQVYRITNGGPREPAPRQLGQQQSR
jgi:hypothetical protein